MCRHYELIFTWLRFTLVPIFPTHTSQRALPRLMYFASILITLFHTLMTLSFAFHLMKVHDAVGMASFVISLSKLIHRYVLCWSTQNLLNVEKLVSKIKTENKSLKRWTYVCMVTSVLYCIIVVITTVLTIYLNYIPNINYLLFGFQWENVKFNQTFYVLANLSTTYFELMPAHVFLMFYISICRDLSCMFDTFRKSMTSIPNPDYNSLLKNFQNMVNLVSEIDNEMNALVFWATLVNISSVYFALALVVQTLGTAQSIAMFYNLAHNLLMFCATCHAASEMSDVASKLGSEAHMLPENTKNSPLTHLRFLLVVGKDVHLTVWKLFPLRKNYILTSIGTIITYFVLVDSLMRNK